MNQKHPLDLLSADPFWPRRDGLPCAFPALDRNAHCEVAVIGGGVTGALMAWHLAEAGVDVVLLERREVAHGSTAGSTSLLQYEIDLPLHRLERIHGRDLAVRSYLRSFDAVGEIGQLARRLKLDCGFESKASLFLASAPGHLAGLRIEYEARRRAGLPVAWQTRGEVSRGTDLPHRAGILSACGAQIDAYRFTYGLLQAAANRGGRIFDRTAVARTTPTARGMTLTLGSGHSVRARRVVLASGYEAEALLPVAVTELQSTFAMVSEPVEAFPGWPHDRCLIWETADPYTYLRTTEDRRVLIGGADEAFRDPAHRDRLVERKARLLQRRFEQWFPRIRFERSGAWAGTFAKTADGLPLIGPHPQVPRLYFALGYGGNGVTFSLIAARLIRDQILGRPNSDAELFGFKRLGKIL